MKIVYVLPAAGSPAMVQEALALQRLGAEVTIAAVRGRRDAAADPGLDALGEPASLCADAAGLAKAIKGADLAVAANAASSILLAESLERSKGAVRAAYAVQDYEPLFHAATTPEWEQSRRSYAVLGDALLYARSGWLCGMVYENHARGVEKIAPGVDSTSFFPGTRLAEQDGKTVTISTAIHPATARRAPKRTVRILERLAALHGEKVELISFGCAPEDLAAAGLSLPAGVDHRGSLAPGEIGEVLRASDLFLDLSDYQATGQGALEAMACGCLPIAPLFGGAGEQVRHWETGWLVDTRSDEAILDAVGEFLGAGLAVRKRMRMAAVGAALDCSGDKAALSQYEAFSRFLG